jgi:hypothetical protein
MLTKLGHHSLDGGFARTLPRIRFRRWPFAIITTLAVLDLQRGMQANMLYAAPSTVSVAVGAMEPRAYAPEGTLADCISYWDAGTHMSKAEWLAACQRTRNGTDPTDRDR